VEAIEHKRKLYNGFGNALSRALEFVAVPLLFGWFGHWLDGRFGTGPLLLVTLGVVGLVGVFMSAWYRYVEAMQAEEAKAPWHKP
jgi:F0F1-type ATP synthase assembly protein I